MEELFTTTNSGLLVSVDWISFTAYKNDTLNVSESMEKLNDIISFLGYRQEQFTLLPKGGMGYKSILKLNGYSLQILYDGKPEMGIHVTISGSAIPEALKTYKSTLAIDTPFGVGYEFYDTPLLYHFLSDIRSFASITRLDLAIDDKGAEFYTMDSLLDVLNDRLMVSKFRNWKNLCSCTTTGEKIGHTIYLGSRKSDIMLRVYDKQLEQHASFPWVRWEFELKDKRSERLVDILVSRQEIGEVCMELLNNYFRIIIPDNMNRSRCTTDPIWLRFVETVRKLHLHIPDTPKTIDDKVEWLKKSVFPTFAGVCMVKPNTMDEFFNDFDSYAERMSKDMLDIVTNCSCS